MLMMRKNTAKAKSNLKFNQFIDSKLKFNSFFFNWNRCVAFEHRLKKVNLPNNFKMEFSAVEKKKFAHTNAAADTYQTVKI